MWCFAAGLGPTVCGQRDTFLDFLIYMCASFVRERVKQALWIGIS